MSSNPKFLDSVQHFLRSGDARAERRSSWPMVMLAILVGSVLLRLAAAAWMGNRIELLPGIADQLSYNTLAVRLLQGHGFTFGQPWWPATQAGEPTAHWSFLYTFYLAGMYKLLGPNPLGARIIQAVAAGVLTPWLVYRLGDRIFGKAAGVIAAAWSGIYPYFIYYGAALMTETFYLCALLLALGAALDIGRRQGKTGERPLIRQAIVLGLSLGVAVLLRQVALVLVPLILGWIVWMRWSTSWRRGLMVELLASMGVILACIIPFTVFNYARFGRFVLLNTNAGFAFYLSNHPYYGTDFQPILDSETVTYADLLPTDLVGLDEAALDQALLRRGIGFVQQDPIRYAKLSAGRIPDYLMFWPSSGSSTISNVARVGSFGLALPFMLAGIWLAFKKRREIYMPGTILLLGCWLAYSAIHILSWSLVRYRLPMDALLLP
ncbi:MAG: glycosyltransferase family 39 protein, partial [Anaerolineales bacterium]